MSARIPYPGLRPYNLDEAGVFFGREEQTDRMLGKLDKHRFLSVVGPSGCGKSSLVRAGMIAALETGFMASAGTRWRVAGMRPGASPMKRLASALAGALGVDKGDDKDDLAVAFLLATLQRGPLGLVEALSETPLPDGTNLLVLVDQFEEIFRYHREGDSDEAEAFVSLLLASASQREMPVYVVLTMRSDFLGDCTLFPGLPEAVNQSQYLTPRLTREQRRRAIVGPARVFGGDVDPALVARMLNDMGPEADELPLMQHVLMRMWTCGLSAATARTGVRGQPPDDTALEDAASADVTPGDDGPTLTVADYDAVGGLATALSKHADEVYGRLTEENQRVTEVLFRCLCERSDDRPDTRHPAALREVAAVAGVAEEKVGEVVEVFRHPDCRFVTPPPGEALRPDTVLDLSHECLIRRWKRLDEWARKESESAETYLRLEQTARLWKAEKADLWDKLNLEYALIWKESETPSAEWAKRYAGKFDLAMRFLDASEREHERVRKKEEAKRQRELEQARALAEEQKKRAEVEARSNRWKQLILLVLGLAVLAPVVAVVGYGHLYKTEYVEFHGDFVNVNGVPAGIYPLTRDQVRRRPMSFRFVRRGRCGPVVRVETVDHCLELTPHHNVREDVLSYVTGNPNRNPCIWKFDYDANDHVQMQTATNRLGQIVFTVAFDKKESAKVALATFRSPSGLLASDMPSGAAHVEYCRDERGLNRKMRLTDEHGKGSLQHRDGYYGIYYKYDGERRRVSCAFLGMDDGREGGPPLVTHKDGFCEERYEYDDEGNCTKVSWYRAKDETNLHDYIANRHRFEPTLHKDGYAVWRAEYDKFGNVVKVDHLDKAGKPVAVSGDCYWRRCEYDEQGHRTKVMFCGPGKGTLALHKDGYTFCEDTYGTRHGLDVLVSTSFFRKDGEPAMLAAGYHAYELDYDKHGNLDSVTYLGADRKPTLHRDGYAVRTTEYDERGLAAKIAYYGTDRKPAVLANGYHAYKCEYDARGKEIRRTWLGVNDEPVKHKDGEAYHRKEYNLRGRQVEVAYYDEDRKPVTVTDYAYHGYWSSYDDRGNEVERRYFGVNREPVFLLKQGYASWKSKYNRRGLEARRAYYGMKKDEKTVLPDGYHAYRSEYDDWGRLTKVTWLGADGKPTKHKDGNACRMMKYDPQGRKTKVAYYDENEQPVSMTDDAYHGYSSRYNDRGDEVERSFFNVERETMFVSGLDLHGRETRRAYYDKDGEKTVNDKGFHSVVYRYDDRGRPIEIGWYGKNGPVDIGKGVHGALITYSPDGKAQASYFNVKGERVEP